MSAAKDAVGLVLIATVTPRLELSPNNEAAAEAPDMSDRIASKSGFLMIRSAV